MSPALPVLIDTSIWIDYFRGPGHQIGQQVHSLINSRLLCTHSSVIGELALGDLGPKRNTILEDLQMFPLFKPVELSSILSFILKEKLYSKGLSWTDLQLLHCCMEENLTLWTKDRTLQIFSKKYNIHFSSEEN